jgi:excisionase family DNA binding protein
VAEHDEKEYLTIREASEYLGVTQGYLRRVLRAHGLDEFMRASMGKEILIRREDLKSLRPSAKQPTRRRGIA